MFQFLHLMSSPDIRSQTKFLKQFTNNRNRLEDYMLPLYCIEFVNFTFNNKVPANILHPAHVKTKQKKKHKTNKTALASLDLIYSSISPQARPITREQLDPGGIWQKIYRSNMATGAPNSTPSAPMSRNVTARRGEEARREEKREEGRGATVARLPRRGAQLA